MSIAQHNTVQNLYIIWSYFPNRTTRHICTIYGTYLDDWCSISGRWVLSICTSVPYLDDQIAIYLYECSISGRWVLHILTSVTYLDDGGYISGRVLHIWTMEVTYLGGCYISGRWRLHIWTGFTYLDGYKSARHILCTANVRFKTPPRHPLSRPWRRVMLCFESGLGKYDRNISIMHCISRAMVSLQSGPVITRFSIWVSAPIMWTHPVQYQLSLC